MDWAMGNFSVHQFMDPDAGAIERDYDQICRKLRVHSRLDSAEALRGLVSELVCARGADHGGTWRFPNAHVLDLPHALLSLLLNLSESPVQSLHTATALQQVRQHRAAARATADGPGPGPEEGSGDASSDGGSEALGSETSLSDWSDDEEDEEVVPEPAAEGAAPATEPAAAHRGFRPPAPQPRWKPAPEAAKRSSLTASDAEQVLISGCSSETAEGGLAQSACSLAAAVAKHHATTQIIESPWPYRTTTEWMIVREASLMMLGEAGGIFEKADCAGSEAQRFHDHIRVQVAHLSPDALLRLLRPLIATANDLLCIRQFCLRHSGGHTASGLGTCATVRAFASGVREVLDEAMKWLTELERRMLLNPQQRATDGSLLWLSRAARPLVSMVASIARILGTAFPASWCAADDARTWAVRSDVATSRVATRLLDTLFTATREGDGLSAGGDPWTAPPTAVVDRNQKIPLALRLLVDAIRPQLMALGAWLEEGSVYDSYGEFCIQASEASTDPRAASFWASAYSLRCDREGSEEPDGSETSEPALVPLLFKSVATGILACGKSAIVCSEDGVNETPPENPRTADDLYRTCLSALFHALRPAASCAAQITNSELWERCLVATVRARCDEQTSRLTRRLMVSHRFADYVQVLRECFFMGDGHFASEVCRYCYRKIDHGESWDDQRALESMFVAVLESHGHLPVDVQVEQKPTVPGRSDIHALDALLVCFKPPWPISIIIDDESIETCNRIMKLLLQVKRAKHALDSMFVRQVHEAGPAEPGLSRAASHDSMLFQAELMHFVNNLHYYLVNRVAYCGWPDFKAELERAPDLDTLSRAYHRYLRDVHDQCLLSAKAKYVMDAILKILDIVLEMKARQSDERVESLRSRFRRLNLLLLQVLGTVVAQGADIEHMAHLSLSLDYNGHYSS